MKLYIGLGLGLLLLGCDKDKDEAMEEDRFTTTQPAMTQGAMTQARRADVPADNAKRNSFDAGKKLNAQDQGGDEGDVKLTQTIRQRVMDKDGLSVNAQNVKIVTRQGAVTLIGPVESAGEKTAIEQIARDVAGAAKVTSQITIVAK